MVLGSGREREFQGYEEPADGLPRWLDLAVDLCCPHTCFPPAVPPSPSPFQVDASQTSEGLEPEAVREYVADLVTRQLGAVGSGEAAAPPFRLHPDQVPS
jgi:hypothetical protein